MEAAKQFDTIIIGGGIAGMTAAVYLARANHSCVVLESNITGGLCNSTYTVENFPSYSDINGMELMQKVRDQVDALGVPVEEVCEITSLELEGEVKRVHTEEGVYEAPTIILATGRKPLPLEVPTPAEQVHHCAICDGAPYKGKRVLVVGGGNSAFDEGLYLMQLGVSHLTLVEAMPRFFAAEKTQDQLMAYDNVRTMKETRVHDLVVENNVLTGAVLENTQTGARETIAVDGVFVFLGQLPNSGLFAHCINLNKQGYVLADADMQTNIPGVFSAGDINAKTFRQLTTAAADGTIASLMADRFLRSSSRS